MVETDWREILSFSQRELAQADKEKLCESLCWMEADDIELNFTDLKNLFRLAQDILKYKSEQVNNLLGQLESSQRKPGKGKGKVTYVESPTRSTESVLETITHQEEVIKANKEILEQLYNDIAELEGRKKKLEAEKDNLDSESSRDPMSEMDAMAQLENEVTSKNRHIRKLLSDIKKLEDENSKLKEKTSVLKEKLTEATQIIENLTEQLFSLNKESMRLKEILGKSEQIKAELSIEIESLHKEFFEKDATKENLYEDIKAKVQHWKNVAHSKKSEIEALSTENTTLKENIMRATQTSSPKQTRNTIEELKIKELQEKLSEASNEIIESANLISQLREENKDFKKVVEETPDLSVSDNKNESDDGKERQMINKLKRKVQHLTTELKAAEEMIIEREKELTEITAQLQEVKTDAGIRSLIDGIKSKERRLKSKDQGIKSLVQEVNNSNEIINDLQLENEALRLKLNIPGNGKISTKGIVSKYRNIEQQNIETSKALHKLENKVVNLELENRNLKHKSTQLTELLIKMGNRDQVEEIMRSSDVEEDVPLDGGGEASGILSKGSKQTKVDQTKKNSENWKRDAEMQALIDENEGLRKGLKEILEFLKDNSTSSSGILALECPSLETVLHSMEARHAAGWFAPHMTAVMELKAAIGGKHALLTALHEARKETFDFMTQLSKESQKTHDLENKIHEIENKIKDDKEWEESTLQSNIGTVEFGSWISGKEWDKIYTFDKGQVEHVIESGNLAHEGQLKYALCYFHAKFKDLFDRMTSLTIQATDDKNKWFIQEEEYKAQIENLKARLDQEGDISEVSPGIIKDEPSNDMALQRKCSYLEESYKYIRTLNENMKNEFIENKKDAMISMSNYEAKIQKLMLAVTSLTDKLRSSIHIDLFWKLNEAFNEMTVKYRKILEENIIGENITTDLLERLETDKIETIRACREEFLKHEPKGEDKIVKNTFLKVEQSILTKQLQQLCLEVDSKNTEIASLEHKVIELQENQVKLIDTNFASATKEDMKLIQDQTDKLGLENKSLKEQCQYVESQLDIALMQLQDAQQRQMSSDMEVNLLRHQILDLQSTSDNKAIIARLSGEVLVAHLQATENHKKIERLHAALMKEKQLRAETEEMIEARQKIFDVYCFRYEFKFRYIYEVMHVLRMQYQGSLPLFSIERYLEKTEELTRKNHDFDEKLDEIEDMRSSLMTKHSVYNQILDVTKAKCLNDEDSCPHRMQNIINEGLYSRELEHCKNKLETVEKSRMDLLKRCNVLEKTLALVNQGFEKPSLDNAGEKRNSVSKEDVPNMEIVDLESDDDEDSIKTVILPKPKLLKPSKKNIDMTKMRKEDPVDDLIGSPIKTFPHSQPELVSVLVQTQIGDDNTAKKYKSIQTDDIDDLNIINHSLNSLKRDVDKKKLELNEVSKVAHQRAEEIMHMKIENNHLKSTIRTVQEEIIHKDNLNQSLQSYVNGLKKQIEEYKRSDSVGQNKVQTATDGGNKSLLAALKKLEEDKNAIVVEYKELLEKEREKYAKSVTELNSQIVEFKAELDRRSGSDYNLNVEIQKESINKNAVKISELEDKCFKSQVELENCNAELQMYKTEMNRWKDLATERLLKMEHLNSQLQERHCHEVESYKAENDHWMHQLNETQREHMEFRSKLSEQKASYVKQLAEKDGHIEQLRNVIYGLKSQIMSIQTMMSAADPSFDLSAIVEVDECSEQSPGTDHFEIKFDSSVDLRDSQDDCFKTPATSSAIWQEPMIERLRREKQLVTKQNSLLRRQIKALAARERRARLDANNLRNQVFRISTSGSKLGVTAETAALHNKVASLQAQLMSARRDTHSNVALWDKWKRAQQASERWQARFEEKCREVKKLESCLQLTKSTAARLEKEKRVLLTRLSESRDEKLLAIEKQDAEKSEKSHHRDSYMEPLYLEPPVSARALMDRVQAQQRRIQALEAAEKGKEYLVSEYERCLAEVTSLKGQVLKLESTLLECQIRTPLNLNATHDSQEDIDYWKNYCEMLKEENVQLNLKVNSLELPTTASHHRVNDLEQTVLTLRGLVSKLQAEQKSSASGLIRRSNSRPNSGRSMTDKGRSQLESCRTEISNLKRTIQDKDSLLERSKEMLKIAAEREDDLLRENAALRHELEELMNPKRGFMSV